MVTVPALTPVTTPELFTVAIAVLDEVHGVVACAVADPVSVVVLPTQTLIVPVMVGKGFTVKLAVCIQSFEFFYHLFLKKSFDQGKFEFNPKELTLGNKICLIFMT